jgi:hypothetical protein
MLQNIYKNSFKHARSISCDFITALAAQDGSKRSIDVRLRKIKALSFAPKRKQSSGLKIGCTPSLVREARHQTRSSFEPVHPNPILLYCPNLSQIEQLADDEAESLFIYLRLCAELVPCFDAALQRVENFLVARRCVCGLLRSGHNAPLDTLALLLAATKMIGRVICRPFYYAADEKGIPSNPWPSASSLHSEVLMPDTLHYRRPDLPVVFIASRLLNLSVQDWPP